MRSTTVLLLCLCLGGLAPLGAEEPTDPSRLVQSQWTSRDGLPSDTALDVVQDARGYVWVATPEGLTRFDGSEFTVWSKNPGDSFAALSARCLGLTADGTLWIGSAADGLYAWSNGGFRHYGLESGLPDLAVSALCVDASGKVWAGTPKGIGYLEGSRFHVIPTGPEFGTCTFFLPLADGGMLTASSLNGLWRVNQNGLEGAGAALAKADRKIVSETVFTAAWQEKSGVLWLGSQEGKLWRMAGDKLQLAAAPARLRGQAITAFLLDRSGTLWIGSARGLLLYRDGRFDSYGQADGLPDDRVSALMQDREGTVWVASSGGGLGTFSAGFFSKLLRRDGLAANACNCAAADRDGNLWVGTDEGLSFLPSGRHALARTAAVDAVVDAFKRVRIRHLAFDRRGRLWIASYSYKGLARFDGKALAYFGPKQGLAGGRFRKTAEDGQGRVWVAGPGGLSALGEGKARAYGKADGLPFDNIEDVAVDAAGAVWVAGSGGVARLEGERFVAFDHSQGLPGDRVDCVFEDDAKRLWAAGPGGVALYDKGRFLPVGVRQGLASDTVFQVLQAMPGRLWLLGGKEIYSLSGDELAKAARSQGRTRLSQSLLDARDGLAGAIRPDGWATRLADGRVLVPTDGGLSVWDPSRTAQRGGGVPVAVDAVDLDGRPVVFPPAAMDLPAGLRRVTVHFAGLSFVAPERLRFRYRLEGFDPDWIDADDSRAASYTNLGPGSYRFRVQAYGSDGVPGEPGAGIELRQAPAWWQSLPFYAGTALALAGAGFAGGEWWRRRRRRLADSAGGALLEHERKRSDGLLAALLPEWAAAELNESGTVRPRRHEAATVLALDLVDFARLSQSLDADRLVTELDELYGAFDDLARAQGVERIRAQGGAYLAAGGLDGADAAPAVRALAVAVQTFLQRRQGADLVPWKARIGIATGPAASGVVGVRKFAFDLYGPAVSLAWRLMRRAAPSGICLDAASSARLADGQSLCPSRPLAVTGRDDVACHFLRYRPTKAAADADPAAVLARIKQLEQAKDYAGALALLRQLDFTVIEADVGHALLKLGGGCAYLAGKPEMAIGAWQAALQYGIVDRALEKSLDALRRR